jgi:tRNA nucleotidyltransferase (CCA-adding enzyme)
VKTRIPRDLFEIEKIFRSAGFELFLVGGAVRNMVLGRQPEDWDLATDARPEEIIDLFRHVIPTGIDHGTVTVRFRKQSYEVTTFRIDGDYSDSRRPDSVEYTGNIFEDLKRRDFSINAMAYNLRSHEILDPHFGKRDIKAKTIRTVGNPLDRFAEDGLRILRGLRFASTLNFRIEQGTFDAMRQRLRYLQPVSIERIRDEFNKILRSPRPSLGISLAEDIGALEMFLPEVSSCRGIARDSLPEGRDLFSHLLSVCDYTGPESLEMRLAGLLHDIGIPETTVEREDGTVYSTGHELRSEQMASVIMRRLKYPKSVEKLVCRLIRHHMFSSDPDLHDRHIRRFISTVGEDLVFDLIDLKTADLAGKRGPFWDERSGSDDILKPRPVERLERLRERVNRQLADNAALTLKDLAVNGNILHDEAGIPRSREMSTVLSYLLEAVLDDPKMNERSRLVELSSNFYREQILPLKGRKEEGPNRN